MCVMACDGVVVCSSNLMQRLPSVADPEGDSGGDEDESLVKALEREHIHHHIPSTYIDYFHPQGFLVDHPNSCGGMVVSHTFHGHT